MIQTIITHSCPKCGGDNLVRNGHDYKGAQKYHCHDCQSYGTLQAQRGYDERTRLLLFTRHVYRVSSRRVLGSSR